MISSKHTDYITSIPSATNNNEDGTAQESDFIRSREIFTTPVQETCCFATTELVC